MSHLFLSACVVLLMAWPAATEPNNGLRADREASSVKLAEAKIFCFSRGCRTLNLRADCRWVHLGGVGRGNAYKVLCDRKSQAAARS
jgi:hypothetical protein